MNSLGQKWAGLCCTFEERCLTDHICSLDGFWQENFCIQSINKPTCLFLTQLMVEWGKRSDVERDCTSNQDAESILYLPFLSRRILYLKIFSRCIFWVVHCLNQLPNMFFWGVLCRNFGKQCPSLESSLAGSLHSLLLTKHRLSWNAILTICFL